MVRGLIFHITARKNFGLLKTTPLTGMARLQPVEGLIVYMEEDTSLGIIIGGTQYRTVTAQKVGPYAA